MMAMRYSAPGAAADLAAQRQAKIEAAKDLQEQRKAEAYVRRMAALGGPVPVPDRLRSQQQQAPAQWQQAPASYGEVDVGSDAYQRQHMQGTPSTSARPTYGAPNGALHWELPQVAAGRRAGQAARATAPAAPQHEARYGRRAEGTGRRKTYEDREDGRIAGSSTVANMHQQRRAATAVAAQQAMQAGQGPDGRPRASIAQQAADEHFSAQRQPSLVPSCALQLGSGAQPHGGQRPGWDSGFTEHSSLSSDASEPRREPAPGGALQWQMVGAPHQAARGAAAEATPTRTELLSRPRWRQPSPSATPAADAGAEYAGYQPAGRLGQASGHQPAQQQGDGYSQALAPGHAAANRQAGSLAARHGGQPQLQEVEVDVEVPDMPGISRAGLLNLRNKLRQQQRATLHSPAAAEAAAMSAATPSTAEPSRQPQQQQAQHFSQPLSLQQPASTKGSHLSRSPSPLQGNAASAGWGQRHRAFAGGFAADAPEENPAGSQMTQAGGFGADGTQESLAGTPGSSDLLQCATCGRTFNPRALEIHTRICNKVFASKRKAFNSAEARVGGTEAEKFADPRAGNLRRGTTAQQQPAAAATDRPIQGSKAAKWKQQSSQLRAAMQAAQPGQAGAVPFGTGAIGGPGPPVEDDRVPCPHCGRRFNEAAAARHIPQCQNIKAKPSQLRAHSGAAAYTKPGAPAPRGFGMW
eukprot:jgi/Astpho2/1251/Aster-x0992